MNGVSEMRQPFGLAIEGLVRRHLGDRSRKIEIVSEKDLDGLAITRVKVHFEVNETYDVTRLTRMREAFANLLLKYPEIDSPSLTFVANMSARLVGGVTLKGPDVGSLRKRIEGLPA